jgi:hypothetical protein
VSLAASAAQLSPPAREYKVRIVLLDCGFSVWCWLCVACIKARKALRSRGFPVWAVKENKTAPHSLRCEDCGCAG